MIEIKEVIEDWEQRMSRPSHQMVEEISKKLEEERAQYFVDTCITYNVQWMEAILSHNSVDLHDKHAVAEKITVYLHMLEAELRRSFDV